MSNFEERLQQKREAEEREMQLSREERKAAPRPTADPPEHILQFFTFSHLPPPLAAVSEPFCNLAVAIVNNLPRNPERTVALRKLLESKDAAVRALISSPRN